MTLSDDPGSMGDCCIVPRAALERLRSEWDCPGRGRLALVTDIRIGGTGHSIAGHLAELGWGVMAAERNPDLGHEAVAAIRKAGGVAWFAHATSPRRKKRPSAGCPRY